MIASTRSASVLLASLAVCGLLAVAAPRAGADPPPMDPQAKAHLDKGLRYYNTADYARAIVEFKAGYDIDPQPALLYALAQAYRLNNQCDKAVEVYKSYLRSNPPEAQRETTQHNIDVCETALTAHSAPPTEPSPTSAPVVAPVQEPAKAVAPIPAPTTAIAPPATPRRPFYTDVLGDVLTGAGAVTVAVGVVVLLKGFDYAGQTASMDAQWHQLQQQASSYETTGGVLIGVGGALVAAGIVKYVVYPQHVEEAPAAAPGEGAVSVSGALLPGGGFLTIGGPF